MLRTILGAIASTLLLASCFAQVIEKEAYIGTTRLTLNLPQSATLNELGRRYRLVEEDGYWQAWSGSGAESRLVGSVKFKNSKLAFISSSAYIGLSGDPDFPHALY